jgi:hypothetical protein
MSPVRSGGSSPALWVSLAVAAGVAIAASGACRRTVVPPVVAGATDASMSPGDRRQQEILGTSAGKPGDPDLMSQFAAINARHFSGELPDVVVRWEPALAEVGPLDGLGLTLQGMFGQAGSDTFILINPAIRADPRAVERALCHEIVHAHLFALGDRTTSHGPAFQNILQRLAREGAFEGIAADAEDKARLRAWLDAESARIDAERREMDALDIEIRQTAAELDREIAAFNAQASRSPAGAEALEARRRHHNQRVLEASDRLRRDRDDLAHFNREVARYNLMMAYPDGLDAASRVPLKAPLPSAGRRETGGGR